MIGGVNKYGYLSLSTFCYPIITSGLHPTRRQPVSIPQSDRIHPQLQVGVADRNQVFGGDVGLDVVGRGEDVAAAGGKRMDVIEDVPADVIQAAERQDLLQVEPAVKGEPVAEVDF